MKGQQEICKGLVSGDPDSDSGVCVGEGAAGAYCAPDSFVFCRELLSASLLTRADLSGAPHSAHHLAWD